MRYADERKLAQDIKNGMFKPVYLLVGDEAFLKTAYRGRLISATLGEEVSGFNLFVYSGSKLELGDLAGAVATLPLMGGRRCVAVDELTPEKVSESDLARWQDILMHIPPETRLLLIQSAPPDRDKKKAAEKFYKLVDDAGGAVVTLDGRKGNDLVGFVVRHCAEGGAVMEPALAGYLIERMGGDMAALGNACDKIAAYAGGEGAVTRAMIEALTPATVEADVYRLSRHIVAGQLDKALRLVDSLDYLKTPVGLIMATLSGAFADLYRAKAGQEKGYSQERIAKDFAYRHAFRVKNALRDARPLNKAHIEAAMAALIEADLLMKTTQADDRALLEQAVVRAAIALRGEKAV